MYTKQTGSFSCHLSLFHDTGASVLAEKKTNCYLKGVRGCHSIGCFFIFDPLATTFSHKETSQLICSANQLNGFYMVGSTDG